MLQGERSGLIYEVARLTEELRPMFVFLENVSAAKSVEPEIETLFGDLGYEFKSTMRDVYSVGGYHKRERYFALAYLESIGVEGMRTEGEQESQSLDLTLLPLRNSYGEWKIEPDVRRIAHGIPHRSHRLRCLGNAVVPKCAREAFKELIGV